MSRPDVVFVHALDLPETVSSYRYMSIIPAQELGARLQRIEIGESADAFLDRVGGEVLVFGKPFEDDRLTLVCERAKARGLKTISWTCDAPIKPNAMAWLQRHIAASDALVVQTAPMARMIEQLTGVKAEVIEECLEYPGNGDAHFNEARDPLQLLWYGNRNNFDALRELLEALAAGAGRNLSLLLLATGAPPPRLIPMLSQCAAPPLQATWAPWSRVFQLQAMRSCDIVLAHSRDAPDKHVKGHNRVTEALNQGCIVVAYPLEHYQELSDYIILDPDPAAGVRRALADPAAALARARAGMAAVRERFAPAVVAAKWQALIERVAKG